MLVGVGGSMVLTRWSGLRASRTDTTPTWLTADLVEILPSLLLLPVGMLLCWPIFFALARLRGRPLELTWAEWLWGVVWLIDLALVGLIAWSHFQGPPSFMVGEENRASFASIARLIVTIVAVTAAGIIVVTMVQRRSQPWTHHFGLALMLWPVAPMLLIWLGKLTLTY